MKAAEKANKNQFPTAAIMALSWLITLVLPLQTATNVSLKSSRCIAFTKKHHRAEKNKLHDPSCQES